MPTFRVAGPRAAQHLEARTTRRGEARGETAAQSGEPRPTLGQRLGPALVVTLGLLSLVACSQAPRPQPFAEEPQRPLEDRPESSSDEAQAQGQASAPEEESAEVSPETSEGEVEKGQREDPDPSVIVIETGKERHRKPSLWEASVAAREARKTARPPVAFITNDNLHEYQDGNVTFAEPSPKPEAGEADHEAADAQADGKEGEGQGEEAEEGEEEGATAEAAPETQGEQYWRSLVLDIRLRMRGAVDEIEALEAEAASLRTSFYAEDDPYVRDGQIKPAWDRAIGRLATTRRRVAGLRQELEEALADGRRAGALAGWLREGIELEPSFEEERSAQGSVDRGGLSIHESREPDTVEPDEPPNTLSEEPPP